MAARRIGRPPKYSEERAKHICDLLAAGSTRKAAAAMSGIHPDTLSDWISTKSDFSVRVEQAEAKFETTCVVGIVKAGREDWRALMALLEKHPRLRKQWGRQTSDAASTDCVVKVISGIDLDSL